MFEPARFAILDRDVVGKGKRDVGRAVERDRVTEKVPVKLADSAFPMGRRSSFGAAQFREFDETSPLMFDRKNHTICMASFKNTFPKDNAKYCQE